MERTVFHGNVHPNTLKCPSCQSRHVIRFGSTPRVFKMLPIGRHRVELAVDIPRLFCHGCGCVRQPDLAFADPKKHYTRSLERFVIDLCRVASIQDVVDLTGLGWDTVKEIHKRHRRRKYKSLSLKKVRYLAINEVYLGKKRKYITIVVDLQSGRVLHVGRGKGKEALEGF